MILHDLRCTSCSRETPDVVVRGGVFPKCRCGGAQTWIPRRVQTDLQPAFFCEATGQWHSRTKDADMTMALQARKFTEDTGIKWTPHAAGDKVGGARNESFARHSAFGYSGQRLRRSSSERSADRGRAAPQERKAAARPTDGARRVTREEFHAQRRDPVWRGEVRSRRR